MSQDEAAQAYLIAIRALLQLLVSEERAAFVERMSLTREALKAQNQSQAMLIAVEEAIRLARCGTDGPRRGPIKGREAEAWSQGVSSLVDDIARVVPR